MGELQYLAPDTVATVAGSGQMKRASWIAAISRMPPFYIRSFRLAWVVQPSTTNGTYSGPFKTLVRLAYITNRDVYGKTLGVTVNPALWVGRFEGHEELATDGATLLIEGSVGLQHPVRVDKPDFGIGLDVRISSEFQASSTDALLGIAGARED